MWKPINKTRFFKFLKKAETDKKYEETDQKFEETDVVIFYNQKCIMQ